MDYLIHQLLTKDQVKVIRNNLLTNQSDWEDGRKTAGQQAAKVKNNLQLNKESSTAIRCSEEIQNQIIANELIKSFCLPKKIHGVMFSKSVNSHGYGMHVDNAFMGSGRSDISFTIFLSEKDSYNGGELCIQTIQENKEIKLSPGEGIFYPSTSLHSVNKVLEGERLACVGWIESYVSSNEDREILFGLHAGAKGILAEKGHSPQLDLIFQAYNNLLRRLGN